MSLHAFSSQRQWQHTRHALLQTARTQGVREGFGRLLHRSILAIVLLLALICVVNFNGVPFVLAASSAPSGQPSHQPDLGPNVYIFNPSMPQSEIQAQVDAVANQQVSNQFGTQRYALLFEPGTYGSSSNPLNFQVGYGIQQGFVQKWAI